MKKYFFLFFLLLISSGKIWATGEPSTYFNIFVPPNNDAVRRDAALVVTAIFDSTLVTIVDDGMDGDTDDNWTGYLMAGQSYILYIRDNGINDDARYASGGVLKQDGDYFIITSNKIVYASQSTNSDWQHDWVPAVNKTSKGEKFIIYSPPFTSSKRDLNVMPYEDSTFVTIKRISLSPTTITGKTNVNLDSSKIVAQRLLRIGEELIYKYTEGRDIMEAGHTYVVETSKPVTLQYGALFTNERDGGGYVPGANGSSASELMYFTVPYQVGGEQEIRIVNWDDNNAVNLSRYSNGVWISMQNWTLNKRKPGDWVGKSNGNASYPTMFRITCSPGKKVSVFEGNWFETGSPGTSDMATMVSSDNGTSAGKYFLSYMAPPGNEQNVRNPFTNQLFGLRLTHLYIFARDTAFVTVKDANTNGGKINRTYTIMPNRYVDCFLTESEWQSIYNGTGTPSGPERPYLEVSSNNPVSVMNSNFNDNWMMYFGSSQEQSFTQSSSSSSSNIIPGDTVKVVSQINIKSNLYNPQIEVDAGPGLLVVNSVLSTSSGNIAGNISPTGTGTTVTFLGEPTVLTSGSTNTVTTTVVAQVNNAQGTLIPSNSISNIETIVSGTSSGDFQQSVSSEGLRINATNTSNLQFSSCNASGLSSDISNSWTSSWIDFDNDGWEDLFVTEYNKAKSNYLYKNAGNGTFQKINSGAIVQDKGVTVGNTWADINNDGKIDGLAINNTFSPSFLYLNQGNGLFQKSQGPDFTKEVSYFHSGAFADYDRDGNIDLFLCNYWPTRFNELHRNLGNGQFEKVKEEVISKDALESTGASWADYDNDGFPDLFIPNHEGGKNTLYHNLGNGKFEKKTNLAPALEGGFAVGSCWGDVDNDGDLDLFVANASNQNNQFFKNLGNGSFQKINSGALVNDKGHSHGCSFADWDKDGDLDLYVTNDQGFKFMYKNDGNGNFTKIENELPMANFGKSFGHSWADFDKDGDLDLFVATHGNQINHLFCNNGNSNKWLNIKLVGTVSNASAIGARVRCKSNGIWQMREITSQSGLGGNNSLRAYFGFGNASSVDSIHVIWPSGIIQKIGTTIPNQFLTITEPAGALVKGKVYYDANKNCRYDSGEPLFSGKQIKIQPGNRTVSTNQAGTFSLRLENGNYVLGLPNNQAGQATCQTSRNILINNVNQNLDSLDFAFEPDCQEAEVKVLFGSTAWRKGFKKSSVLELKNDGLATARNISLSLKFPSFYKLKSAGMPYSLIENQAFWNIDSLPAGKTISIQISDSISRFTTVGQEDSVIAMATFSGAECHAADNKMIYPQTIVGAIDPNDITVWPKGAGSKGLIEAGQTLHYRIRFHNKGTYMAENVHIEDVLPDGLDLSSLEMESQSHASQWFLKGKVLNFDFLGIQLPDSISEPEKSQGFVIFKIKTLSDAAPGTVIGNMASIVFDYEDPIRTNRVSNTILNKITGNLNLEVWPNPARKEVNWNISQNLDFTLPVLATKVNLKDMLGREIKLPSSDLENGKLNLPTEIQPGMYILQIEALNGQMLQEGILVE